MRVLSGIELKSAVSDLSLRFQGEFEFHSDDDVQNSVASLAKDIFNNNAASKAEVGGAGFMFGSDSKKENIVDTFSKVAISIPISKFIPELSKKYDTILQSVMASLDPPNSLATVPKNNATTAGLPVVMKKAEVDIIEKNTMSIETEADVSTLPFKVQVDMPLLSIGIRSNNDDIVKTTVDGTKVSPEGKFSSLIKIKFQENDQAYQTFCEIANMIQAHQGPAKDHIITTHSLIFGKNGKEIKTFQKVEMPLNIKPIVTKMIETKPDPNANIVYNWWSVLTEQGVVTLFQLFEDTGADFSWFKMKAKITAKTAVQKDRKGEVVFVANIKVVDIKLPKVNAILIPILENDSTAKGLFMGTDKFLAFEDFGSDGRNGYTIITGSNGAKLDAFKNNWVWAGEVKLFHPLTMNMVPIWPMDIKDPLQFRLPLQVLLSFKNGGPLHMDIGKMKLNVYLRGRKMLGMESRGDWVVRNWLEGAGDEKHLVNQGKFYMEIPLRLFATGIIELIAALVRGTDLQFELTLLRGDHEITWAPKIFDALNKMGGLESLGPMIGTILKNINFKVFGIGKRHKKTMTIGPEASNTNSSSFASTNVTEEVDDNFTNGTLVFDPNENLTPIKMVDTSNLIIVTH